MAPKLKTTTPQEAIRSVFAGLGDEEVAELLEAGEVRNYPPGYVLCREGEMEHTFYLMLSGLVDITIRMLDGTPRKVSERQAGDYFGEMALIERKPRSATVTTVTKAAVLEFSEDVFDGLLRHNPSVAFMVLRRLTSYLRNSDQAAIADLSRKNDELAKAYTELQTAQAELVSKERMERELEIAAEVQRSMLPAVFPLAEGWEFAGRNVPARSVGGDLFDVIRLDDDHLGILLADVSDKSVHAALFMAVTRTLFLAESARTLSPLETATNVHRGILGVSSRDDMFVTAFYGVLNVHTGELRYVRAGQDFPLLMRKGATTLEQLEPKGRFLGMLPDVQLEEVEDSLYPGDTLIIYSDGVTDMLNLSGEFYGVEQLHNLMKANEGRSASELCDLVFDAIDVHRAKADAFDDATLLIVRRKP